MMRWPSAYWATSSGMSRSTMRNSTQPTRPAELRTRYQSSITGLGGSASFPWVAIGCGGLDCVGGVGCGGGGAGVVGVCAGGVGADAGFWSGRAAADLAFRAVLEAAADTTLGRFLSEVARLRTSTFSPSLS